MSDDTCPHCSEQHDDEHVVRLFAVREPFDKFLDEVTGDPYQLETMTTIREKLAALEKRSLHCTFSDAVFTHENLPTAFVVTVTINPVDSNELGVAIALLCRQCADAITPESIGGLSIWLLETLKERFAQGLAGRLTQ